MNDIQGLGIFEIFISIFSIGFSYWGFYKFMSIGIWWGAILLVIIFLGYGLLGLSAGIDNLKRGKK